MKLPVHTLQLTLAVSLVLMSNPQVQAHPDKFITSQNQSLDSGFKNRLVFAAPPIPPGSGAPGRRTDTSGRDPNCASTNKPLTALVPVYGAKSGNVWGLTVAEHPTLWFYVGYKSPCIGEFLLWDSSNQLVYRTKITLPETPGVVSLSIPSTIAPLKVGQQYHWFFKVYPDTQNPPVFVEGWIQRAALNSMLKSQIEKANLQERTKLFATNGYWYDALTAAAKLHQSASKTSQWTDLLRSVSLDAIAPEPIVDCCKPTP